MHHQELRPSNILAQPKPMQFGLRSIFVLTAITAAIAAAARVGGMHGVLLVVAGLAAARFTWSLCSCRAPVSTKSLLVLVSSVLLLVVLPPQSNSRPTRRYLCHCNLKQISLALLNYHDKHGRFPPAVVYDADGKPMHSWRTLILPEIEYEQLYNSYNFDEPWHSVHNQSITQVDIGTFGCPSDQRIGRFDTSYVALIGPDSIWSGEGAKASDITDGENETVILIEMKNSGIHWAEPRDLDLANLPSQLDKKKLLESLGSHIGAVVTAFADGHVESIPVEISLDGLKALASKSGGDTVDRCNTPYQIIPASDTNN
jgi:prepilin-type processing-associated H-X9-DG protein